VELIQKTIGRCMEDIAGERSSEEAIIHTELGLRYGYGLLLEEIGRTAAGFIGLGLEKGDKVAIWAPNTPDWIISMLALAGMGAVTVPIDPGVKKDDLRLFLEDSECRGIVMAERENDKSYPAVLQDVWPSLPNLKIVVVIGDEVHPRMISWSDLGVAGRETASGVLTEISQTVRPEDPVAIMYTSGTTGKPKGVVLDHLALINKSMASTERQGIDSTDRLCLFFPLFHMFGNTCVAMAGLLRGATLIMPCRSFDPLRILRAISEERCTAIYASPNMIISLLDHPAFEKNSWRSVRKGIIGGAPCPIDLMRRLVEDIGVSDITVGYGITETSSWITMTRPQDPTDLRVSTIGKSLECNEIRVVDPATGEVLARKTQGEICTRGFLMKGYYRMPGATSAAVDREGWFHTGDLGEMDENGYVRITGRLKDVIVRGGIEIFPLEVEEVIYQMPDVSEVQVFGFPHRKTGQEVAAWVKLKQDSPLSSDEISAYVEKNVDSASAPHFYKIVSSFPTTRSGKVQKFRLAEMAAEEYAEASS
jgi:fatty-acyl-CoA synthase